jgi:hypothetical protein
MWFLLVDEPHFMKTYCRYFIVNIKLYIRIYANFVELFCVSVIQRTEESNINLLKTKKKPTKDLTEGGDLREAQVDALGLCCHSCLKALLAH